MSEFNLIEVPWIPCIDRDGNRVEYGIRSTLLKAHELREICDDSPLVTVAIHRLLLAILYRAFQGPKEMREWKTLYQKGGFAAENGIGNYLEQWRDRFYLFDDVYPFFQMAGFKTKKAISVNRLSTECASGNNATLFDHSTDDKVVEWDTIQATKQLLACQSFALGFGKSGNAKIDGSDETLPYSKDAIALRGITVWLQGETLFDTLMINLIPSDDGSLPPWECDDPHKHRDRLEGKYRKSVGSLGLIDRMTWQSRLVRLLPNDGTVSEMFFTQGRSADKLPGDPMKVYRMSKEEGVSAVSLSSSKAAWRDVHSILMIPPPNGNEHRPECFNLIARARSSGIVVSRKMFVAHVAGLASAPNKAGKFLLWRHEHMPMPAALLADSSLIERMGGLVQEAEQASIELNNRTRRIVKLYLSPSCESPNAQQPDKDEVNKVCSAVDSRPAFWARLELHFYELLANLPNDWDTATDDWKPDDQQAATNKWRWCAKDEAKRALEESIRSLGTTARAIQAVARIRTDFNDHDLKPPPEKAVALKEKRKRGKKSESH